jgi:hypothetical protein
MRHRASAELSVWRALMFDGADSSKIDAPLRVPTFNDDLDG